jgi:hypothetical protein
VGLTSLPCKKKIVEKPPRNSDGFCGGDQGLSWAVEPRKEEKEEWLLMECMGFSARCTQLFLLLTYSLIWNQASSVK